MQLLSEDNDEDDIKLEQYQKHYHESKFKI